MRKKQIENLVQVGINGEEIPESISSDERTRLYPPLGIVEIVKLTWVYDGRIYALDLRAGGSEIIYDLLPDRSGFLVTIRESSGVTSAAVWNADLSVRFVLSNPWPTSPLCKAHDKYEFVWPTTELGRPGVIISVSATGTTGIFTVSDYFFAIDPETGVFTDSHPFR